MYCNDCGTQIANDANFCSYCGKSQTANFQENDDRWETCEIEYDIASTESKKSMWAGYSLVFWANAIGINGQYNAGTSTAFDHSSTSPEYNSDPKSTDEDATTAHRNLIQQLTTHGWESTGDRGNTWWSSRFRRKATIRLKSENMLASLVIVNKGYIGTTVKIIRESTNLEIGDARTLAKIPNTIVVKDISINKALQIQSRFHKEAGAIIKIVPK